MNKKRLEMRLKDECMINMSWKLELVYWSREIQTFISSGAVCLHSRIIKPRDTCPLSPGDICLHFIVKVTLSWERKKGRSTHHSESHNFRVRFCGASPQVNIWCSLCCPVGNWGVGSWCYDALWVMNAPFSDPESLYFLSQYKHKHKYDYEYNYECKCRYMNTNMYVYVYNMHIIYIFDIHLQLTLEQCESWGNWHRKSMYNFWLPRNFTTHSQLLTGSLINNINSQVTHILHDICIIYCTLTMK